MQLARIVEADYVTVPADDSAIGEIASEEQLLQAIAQLDAQMREAAKNFDFERAAAIRDRIRALKQRDLGVISSTELPAPISAATVDVAPEVRPKRGLRSGLS
jgi:excinuclease ABC subunit B